MKQLGQLKDNTKFKFNKRSKVVWEIQNKFKQGGTRYATITATVSKRTLTKFASTPVWVIS